MAVLNFIQAPKFVLAGSGTSIGDTSIILQSMVGIDAANIVTADLGTKAYGTLEPGNGTQEEAISFTGVTQNANGTATLTGVKTCLFKSPYTETSGLAKTHAGASTFILSNDAGFYNNIMTYVNTSLSSGAVPATTSVNGIVTLSTTPASAATPVVISDTDTRLPTQSENDALAGNGGTPSSSNKYVTETGFTTSLSATSIPLVTVYTTPGTATWTRSANCKYVVVEVQGAGGSGATNGTSSGFDSSGGAGGYAKKLMSSATTGTSQTVTVGTGGAAKSTYPSSGADGTDSSFGSFVIGGKGGGGQQGSGGGTGGSASGGDINIPGQPGTNYLGGNASYFTQGGQSFFGTGGITGGNKFMTKTGYGAGGYGYFASIASEAGGNGIVIVTEYYI